jgi:hypothetical protein
MLDMEQSGKLFEASARLESAAEALQTIASAGEHAPNEAESSALKWAGQFLTDLDWKAGNSSSGRLSVAATKVRPTFYATILKVRTELEREGLSSEQQLTRFFSDVYGLLLSEGKKPVEKSRIVLAASFLRALAQGILSDLTRPSLSRPSTMQQ